MSKPSLSKKHWSFLTSSHTFRQKYANISNKFDDWGKCPTSGDKDTNVSPPCRTFCAKQASDTNCPLVDFADFPIKSTTSFKAKICSIDILSTSTTKNIPKIPFNISILYKYFKF